MSEKIITLNEEAIKGQLGDLVRQSVEDTLNALLDEEADRLTNATRYERTEGRKDTRAGHYKRKLLTKAGEVDLKVPKLRVFCQENFLENVVSFSRVISRPFPGTIRPGWWCLAHQGMGHAVTLPFKQQEVAVVDQAVNHGCRHLLIGKDAAPFGELQVGGQDQTLAFIAIGDHPKEQLGALAIHRHITPLVKDQQVKLTDTRRN